MGLATRLGRDPVVVGDTAFYGLDFVPRNQRADLDYEFAPHDAAHATLVSHGLFEPLVPDYGNVEWDAAEVLEASTVDFDAMLLGDEHAATRAAVDGTWVTYCGSTERASASEREERGYNIVEFGGVDEETPETGGEVHIARRGIETREFVFLDLELAESEGFGRVRERLREHDLEDAVVHVTLSGDGEAVSAARVEEFADEAGALVARVNDRREVSEDADLDVAFADPDEAVRERVRGLGLSRAARDLDETIRASKVADANVADEVQRRVAELVDEPSAFESTPAEAPETVADREDGADGNGGESAGGTDSEEATTGGGDVPAGNGQELEPDDADADGGPAQEAAGDEPEPGDADGRPETGETDADPDREAADGQASVEDYL
jgi:DNA repair exonuclease SbcCD nuclease subunit